MPKPLLLWVGFGDLGHRSVAFLQPEFEVIGVRRSASKRDDNSAGVRVIQGDASKVQDWLSWLALKPHTVVISLTPGAFSAEAYEQGYLKPIQEFCKAITQTQFAGQVVFISSTSVYGQTHGEFVDEDSPTEPDGFSGQAIRACERVLEAAPLKVAVLRCSGIYGPGRTRLIEHIKSGQYSVSGSWTNRIHATDVARAVAHVIERDLALPTAAYFNVTDDMPVQQAKVMHWLAERLNPEAKARVTEGSTRGSKRISNRKLTQTGFKLYYPNYQKGYSELIEH